VNSSTSSERPSVSELPLPPRDMLIRMLRQMYEVRLFEEALFHAFKTEKMPGTMHQAIGMEAVSVGIGQALRSDDVMTSTHRGHGHAIAKGLPLNQLMAEMYARQTGISRGMGGSMHLFDVEAGFLGTTGIVGAGAPIAVGAALALKLEGTERIAVTFFGDGGANQGVVHEAMNMAAIWKLPVLFVCENNRYAVSMPVEKAVAINHIVERAAGYGMPGVLVDGNDVIAVYQAAAQAAGWARHGEGPTLLECETYRYKGHSRFEPATYRPAGELEAWMSKDPINRLRHVLEERGLLTANDADAVRQSVDDAVQNALKARLPPPSRLQPTCSPEHEWRVECEP
jgi:TPP-dependent pyruvate/acetoin dehydrogenase alpha subunit